MHCTCRNKEGLASICMHPHTTSSSVSFLSFSTLLLTHTACVPAFRFIFYSVFFFSKNSNCFLIAYPDWFSASKVPLGSLPRNSRAWGSDFSGSGCDAEKDKLNSIRIIYIFLTAHIAGRDETGRETKLKTDKLLENRQLNTAEERHLQIAIVCEQSFSTLLADSQFDLHLVFDRAPLMP